MQRLRRVYSFVEKIISMTPAELVLFLKKSKKIILSYIQQIILNYLEENFHVPDYITNRLKKFKAFIRNITRNKLNLQQNLTSPRLIKIIQELLPFVEAHLGNLIEKNE